MFRKMMQDVLAPNADVHAILVLFTSRFMRHAGKARIWKDHLRRRGIDVIAIQQETSDNPMGNFMEGVFELIDEYESNMNGLRTYAAVRYNATLGFVSFKYGPLGFRTEPVAVGANTRRRLVPEPLEIPIVNACLHAYIEEGGALQASKRLNAMGLRHRAKPFTKDRVLAVVSETALVGTYQWGKTKPREEWVSIPVEAIVSRELFDAAQRVRAEREPQRRSARTSSSPLLLAGLMRCGQCGGAYTLETAHPRARSGAYAYRYANCRVTKREGKERCPGHRLRLDALEEAVKRTSWIVSSRSIGASSWQRNSSPHATNSGRGAVNTRRRSNAIFATSRVASAGIVMHSSAARSAATSSESA